MAYDATDESGPDERDAPKLQETEIIRIFLLWEFAWRNQVMGEHGEC
jgi:hypothetical protein